MLSPVTIIIRGPHDSGRTTLAHVIENFLEENGYRHVLVKDTEPLPQEAKASFWERFTRNRDLRPINIVVELEAAHAADEYQRGRHAGLTKAAELVRRRADRVWVVAAPTETIRLELLGAVDAILAERDSG